MLTARYTSLYYNLQSTLNMHILYRLYTHWIHIDIHKRYITADLPMVLVTDMYLLLDKVY